MRSAECGIWIPHSALLNFSRPVWGPAAEPPAQAVVFAQGIAVEALPGEQALEVGMALEADAEHVPDLALLQVRPLVNRIERGHGRRAAVGHLRLHEEAVIL